MNAEKVAQSFDKAQAAATRKNVVVKLNEAFATDDTVAFVRKGDVARVYHISSRSKACLDITSMVAYLCGCTTCTEGLWNPNLYDLAIQLAGMITPLREFDLSLTEAPVQ